MVKQVEKCKLHQMLVYEQRFRGDLRPVTVKAKRGGGLEHHSPLCWSPLSWSGFLRTRLPKFVTYFRRKRDGAHL
jgi:hypothetical protein